MVSAGVVSEKEISDPSSAYPKHVGCLSVWHSGCGDGVDDDFVAGVLLLHAWHGKGVQLTERTVESTTDRLLLLSTIFLDQVCCSNREVSSGDSDVVMNF